MKSTSKLRRKFDIARDYMNIRGVLFLAQRRLRSIRGRRRVARFVSRFLPRPAALVGQHSAEAMNLQVHGFAAIEGIVTTRLACEIYDYLTR